MCWSNPTRSPRIDSRENSSVEKKDPREIARQNWRTPENPVEEIALRRRKIALEFRSADGKPTKDWENSRKCRGIREERKDSQNREIARKFERKRKRQYQMELPKGPMPKSRGEGKKRGKSLKHDEQNHEYTGKRKAHIKEHRN